MTSRYDVYFSSASLIPNPTTDLDRRVNRAYELAVRDQEVKWVWVQGDHVLIGRVRPPNMVAVAVHPEGFALVLAAEAEPPWREN